MSKIINIDEFAANRGFGRVAAASGGFDPIHPGHASYLKKASELADILVVIVNGDGFLTRKKGQPFMPVKDRCQIVSMIQGVDFVVPFDPTDPNDNSVSEALQKLKPDFFAKGGDRTDESNIPEWDTCKTNAIKVETGVGWDKEWSSSNYLGKWAEFKNRSFVDTLVDAGMRIYQWIQTLDKR